ncbi:MAG: peptidyl-tRNA hydrolase Pth2 [Halobacteria archaeon]|nr:peptidyl-tRNA hydrolase Pth2 [Halobacteria archaeon]
MKQSIVIRTDLGMGEGKKAAQAAHASLQAYEKAPPDIQREWKEEGMKKIVLKARDESELLELKEEAGRAQLPFALIRDAGHTQIEPGTLTALAVGPGDDERVDRITGHLTLL